MATIQEHIAYVRQNGLARTNRFQTLIPLPNVISNPSSPEKKDPTFISEVVKYINVINKTSDIDRMRGLDLMCEQSEIPGKSLTTSDMRYNGDFIKQPNGIIYGIQPFTFHVGREMYEKNIIDEWMNKIIDVNKYEIAYYDDYTVDITINQLDTNGNVVYSVILEEAYPTVCNPLTLSNSEQNNTHRLMVQFTYRRFRRVGADDDDGLADRISETPFGPILAPILSNPIVKQGLDILEQDYGIDLEGEALNMYNMIDQIVRNSTDQSIGKLLSSINAIRASIEVTDKISDFQKAGLLKMVNDLIKKYS